MEVTSISVTIPTDGWERITSKDGSSVAGN